MSSRRLGVLVGMLILLGTAAWNPTIGRCQEPPTPTRAQKLKALQQRRLFEGARRRLARYQARALAPPGTAAPGTRRRLPPDATEAGGPQGTSRSAAAMTRSPDGLTSYLNTLVNNRATDRGTGSGQCEVSIAANGNNVLAAWNDGEGFVTGTSTQGFAYSTDGGHTWVDGGAPPTTNVGTWTSDPVVAVNEKTGAFYYAALCEPTASSNGIGVVQGTFSGSVFTWGTPELAISSSYFSAIYDKEWLAADSVSSNLYLVYSRFTISGGSITTNRIDFQRKVGVAAFSAPVQISSPPDDRRVQAARVAVGPGGEVWAAWNAIGTIDVDHMRVRRSLDGGGSFGSQVTAVSEFTNFGSGAPGFNRGHGFAFPGLAVDRTSGPYRGRAYLAWNESVDFYWDLIGNMGSIPEVEPNDIPATGTPFTMGKRLTGTISSSSDFDYWQFNGTAGQTIICQADASFAPSLNASFRLFCSDGTTRLAFSETGVGGTAVIVFTVPVSGAYTLRVAPFSGSGAYVIDTGLNGAGTERGRDHRDVFVSYSDNGISWDTPVRVNDDPPGFDNWLPEIAVADIGRPYVIWYDWRDAPPSTCGGASHVYLSRSENGGVDWVSMGPITDAQTAWTSVSSNIAPNQGDYMGLFGDGANLHAAWADGRLGDPDVFYAIPLPTPVLISTIGAQVEPGLVRITWHTAEASGFAATVYRRTGDLEWTNLGLVSPNGTGEMVFEDRSVVSGTTYYYRLGVVDGGQESFMGEVTVSVPAALRLTIEAVHPNPADREMWVSFSLPLAEPAHLELIDVSGRRVREQAVSGTGRQTIDLVAGVRLSPGLYLIRLTQAGQSTVRRVSVVR